MFHVTLNAECKTASVEHAVLFDSSASNGVYMLALNSLAFVHFAGCEVQFFLHVFLSTFTERNVINCASVERGVLFDSSVLSVVFICLLRIP